MKSIEDSFWIKVRIDDALDENNFMCYTTEQKISKLKKLDKWVKNALENSMYPLEETNKLKDLRTDINNHLITLSNINN